MSPTMLPDLGKIAFPWLQPGVLGPKPVTHATVLIETALINAAKTDGRCWDPGCNESESKSVAKAASKAAVAAIGTAINPYAAAFAVLYPIMAKGWSNPDSFGWATVIHGGVFSKPQKLKVGEDTLTPQWGLKFEHVPIAQGTVVRLEFIDADYDANDPMGICMITAEDLTKAMKAGKTTPIRVNDQTNEQVLFVNVSVLAEQG